MPQKTLEELFNAVFHDKRVFLDFCNLEMEKEVEVSHYKDRKVYKTSDKLKKIHKFINNVILRNVQTNDHVVHSYIKGKSALTAVKAHAKSKFFFNTDIESFFSNIRANDVESIFSRDLDSIQISDWKEYTKTLTRVVTFENTLPAGFATSPQISNAFLLNFDNHLNDFCDKKGLIYTRYSDDIIISSNFQQDLKNIDEIVQKYLDRYATKNLTINKSKTRYTHTGNKVKILGLVITPKGKVTIDSKYKKILESIIYFYINDKEKFNDLLTRSFAGKERSLFGLLHYARSIDPNYLKKLQKKYGAYTLNELMKDK